MSDTSPTGRRRMRLRATAAACGALLMLAVAGCTSGGQGSERAVGGDTSVDIPPGSGADGPDRVDLRGVVFDVRRDPG